MAKFNSAIQSFAGGEVSPNFARTDAEVYKTCCSEMTNALAIPTGPAYRRLGTKFLNKRNIAALSGVDSDEVVMVPVGAAFILLIYKGKVSDWKILSLLDGTFQTVSPISTSTYTDNTANTIFDDITCSWDYANKSTILVFPKYGVFAYTNGLVSQLSLADIYGNGIAPWEKVPYHERSVNGVGIADPGTIPPALSVVAPNITTYPADRTVTASSSFYGSLVTKGTWVKFNFEDSGTPYTVAAQVKSYTDDQTGVMTFHAVSNRNYAGVNITLPLTFNTAGDFTKSYEVSAFSNAEDGSFDIAHAPYAVSFHDNRLIFLGMRDGSDASPISEKGKCYASSIIFKDRFMEVPFQQDPTFSSTSVRYFENDLSTAFSFSLPLASNETIMWATSFQNLLVCTTNGEISVSSGDSQSLAKNGYTFITRIGDYGTQSKRFSRVFNTLVYIDKTKKDVVLYLYDDEGKSYKSRTLSNLSSHFPYKSAQILKDTYGSEWSTDYGLLGFEEIILHEGSPKTLWIRDTIGSLFSVVLSDDYSVASWSAHRLGGIGKYVNNYNSQPRVIGFAAPFQVQNSVGLQVPNGALLFAVRRFDSSVGTYEETISYEHMGNLFTSIYTDLLLTSSSLSNIPYKYLDCFVVRGQDPTTFELSLVGTPFLHTQRVDVVTEQGDYLGEFIVGAGTYATQISLPKFYGNLYVGYKYGTLIRSMPIEVGSSTGDAVGLQKKLDRLYMSLHATQYIEYGVNNSNPEVLPIVSPGSVYDPSYPIQTKQYKVTPPAVVSDRVTVYFKSDKPHSFGIAAYSVRGVTYE